MMKNLRNVCQAAACLLCAIAAWSSLEDLIGTEVSGGRITSPMLDAGIFGAFLFLIALVLSFFSPTAARVAISLASLLCLPVYVYRTLPGVFRWIFPGEYKVMLHERLIWHSWSVTGAAATALVIFLSILVLWPLVDTIEPGVSAH